MHLRRTPAVGAPGPRRESYGFRLRPSIRRSTHVAALPGVAPKRRRAVRHVQVSGSGVVNFLHPEAGAAPHRRVKPLLNVRFAGQGTGRSRSVSRGFGYPAFTSTAAPR